MRDSRNSTSTIGSALSTDLFDSERKTCETKQNKNEVIFQHIFMHVVQGKSNVIIHTVVIL